MLSHGDAARIENEGNRKPKGDRCVDTTMTQQLQEADAAEPDGQGLDGRCYVGV
jgi:hypothetical protein